MALFVFFSRSYSLDVLVSRKIPKEGDNSFVCGESSCSAWAHPQYEVGDVQKPSGVCCFWRSVRSKSRCDLVSVLFSISTIACMIGWKSQSNAVTQFNQVNNITCTINIIITVFVTIPLSTNGPSESRLKRFESLFYSEYKSTVNFFIYIFDMNASHNDSP